MKETGKLLLESIRLIEGDCPLLTFHQDRVDRSRKLLYPKASQFRLRKLLEELPLPSQGEHKIRLVYGQGLEDAKITAYEPRSIESIRLVDSSNVRYSKKYEDRSAINACFEQRADCDDVLMIQRGFVTDTSYANLALFDGIKWFTPSVPMLRGTRRAKLLREGTLKAAVIREKDLPLFKKIRLINAMLPWGQGPELMIEQLEMR